MNRRAMLRTTAGLGVGIGATALAGCLGSDGVAWTYGVGDELDAVADGTVYVRERSDRGEGWGIFGPDADGQVVALAAETGEVEWTHGGTGQLSTYTPIQIDDGVYFGYCSDDDCIGLYALEPDGEERWQRDVGVGRDGPLVANDVVYVATDQGIVRAVDAATGEDRWRRHVRDPDGEIAWDWSLAGVGDAVSVAGEASLVALALEDGATRLRYDRDGKDGRIVDVTAGDDVDAVATDGGIATVADSAEIWRRAFERAPWRGELLGTASERLLTFGGVEHGGNHLRAYDLADGERLWSVGPIGNTDWDGPRPTLGRDRVVYANGGRLRALETVTGEERWSADLEAGPVRSMTTVEDDGDASLVVLAGSSQIVTFDSSGERRWSESVDGRIRNYLVGERVYVATNEAVYALDWTLEG